MAKKSSIEKNNRRKKLAKKYAGRRSRLKAIAMDKTKPMEERFAATMKLAELPRNSSPQRYRNRCEMTGRPRAVYRKHKLSRIALRELGSKGFIRGYTSVDHSDGRSEIEVELKYFDGQPVIREMSRVSKPGRRVYVAVRNLPRINNGLGVAILSTPKGVMADHDARDANVGGEVLCTVF